MNSPERVGTTAWKDSEYEPEVYDTAGSGLRVGRGLKTSALKPGLRAGRGLQTPPTTPSMIERFGRRSSPPRARIRGECPPARNFRAARCHRVKPICEAARTRSALADAAHLAGKAYLAKHRGRGLIGRLRTLDATAATMPRSAAGSSTAMPPATLTNTSSATRLSPPVSRAPPANAKRF